jgi:hypothetical protein
MATTFAAAGAALVANAASFASVGLSAAADCTAIGQFLIACGNKPGLSVEILRLINNVNLTENRP